MAYRQLRAVTFAVLGLLAVACGGGTSSGGTTGATGEQPPTNTDQAPDNASDTASNPDAAPRNPDSAPSSSEDSAGSGGGGRLTALCERVCSTLTNLAEDCSKGMTKLGMEDVCSADVNCQIPANVPCQDEIAEEFDCVLDAVASICSAARNDDADPKAQPCQDAVRNVTSCLEASGFGAQDPNPNNGPGKGPSKQADCTTAGGCECGTDCSTCVCEAGTDADELAACATACSTP